MTERKRLFIIDAMALAFRSFYALGRSGLATSQGLPTGAIHASALFLTKLLTEQRPDYLVAVTDSPEPTFRHALYREYKATRDRMPDDLAKQLPSIFELFGHLGCRLLREAGVEADDVIATLATRFGGPGVDVYIVSGDKDFLQLVGDHVFLYAPKKNEDALVIDRAGVKERYGCAPEQIVDLLALVGDAVDNVPGVQGIGEKGAAKLIETYGTLEGIYEHLAEITAKKQREGLETCREEAFLSRQLVTLKRDVALGFGLDELAIDPAAAAFSPRVLAFYESFELKALAQRVKTALAGRGSAPSPEAAADSMGGGSAASQRAVTTTLVHGEDLHQRLADELAAAPAFALAVLGSGHDIVADKATSVAFSINGDESLVVNLDEEGIYRVRPLLAQTGKAKIGHGLKVATELLRNVGLTLAGPLVDLEVCDYLLDPNNYDHSLAGLSQRHLGEPGAPDGEPALQAAQIRRLHDRILPKIREQGLMTVLEEIEMPLIPVLAEMEQEGFYVDAELLLELSNELDELARRLEEELYAAVGERFNINSPKQLQELLFERLKLQEAAGLKRLKRTKTGLSTDESVLTRLARVHPVPKLILDYRTVSKLKNTYVDPLAQFIHPRTGRVHTCFRQTVASTGRLSSDQPNLQNIPMRTELGRKIRKAFKAQAPGSVLVSADYSQVELRLLAHLSGDPGLIEAFRRDLDVHRVTAAKIFGVSEEAVDPLMRSRAKAVNFGIIYGMGPQRLAQETGVTLGEAKDFIARYFEVYPGIKSYTEGLIEQARRLGYCVTIKGRRRPIPEMQEKNRALAARAENIAVNAPIQGSAADLIKLAMIRVQGEIRRRRLKARLLLQVHDELVLCTPEKEREVTMALVRECMETAIPTSVPLKAEVSFGKDWLAAH